MVDKNSVSDRNSVKLVDESSVVVENSGLEKAVVYQSIPKYTKVCFPKVSLFWGE